MSDWHRQSVLLTGCTGFVSSWVAKRLISQGARLVGVVRDRPSACGFFFESGLADRIQLVHGDITDAAFIQRIVADHELDIVLHLAAQTDVMAACEEPLHALEVNTRGTWNLLEAVRRSPRHTGVVLVSTDAVYGETGEHPSTETAPFRCDSPYEVSKACAEMIGRTYFRMYDLPVCIARLSNVYGPGDVNYNRIVPGTIRSVLSGQRPKLRSDGRAVRDYLYVEDAAEALTLLAGELERPGVCGEVFNVGSEHPMSVLRIVELILKVAGRPELSPEIGQSTSGEVSIKKCSSYKFRNELNWQPRHTLEAGLNQTVEWYRTQCAAQTETRRMH